MAKNKEPKVDSKAEIESAMLNEMDEIGAGDIPAEVKEQAEKEKE